MKTLPKVGEGATILHTADRMPYQVLEVSDDFKRVKLEVYSHKADKTKECEHGHQNWLLEPTGYTLDIVYRYNNWYVKTKTIDFTKDWYKKYPDNQFNPLTDEQIDDVYMGNAYPINVVDGITEEITIYNKIDIIFGVMEYYYYWEL